METRTFNLKYGQGEVNFSIPKDQLLHEVLGVDYPPISNVAEAIQHVLEHPIDSPPLKELVKPGEKVVLCVSDITRGWQNMSVILPFILDALNQGGVSDNDVTIIIAVGGHRQNTQEEFIKLCGKDVFDRVKIVNHDAWDESNLVYMGKTSRNTEVWINRLVVEANKVILTGGIIYHYMCGYGGGRKSILPGVSSIKTIRQNHLLALGPNLGDGSDPNAVSARTRGCNGHEDMMEIAAFVQADFLINMVPTVTGEYAGVFAGNWVSAWQEGTKLVDRIYGVPIEAKADIVIASAGGFPKDINLYQTGKPMDNACYAVKDGGVVIILSECADINEPIEFTEWFQYGSKLEMEKALRAKFTIPGWVAFREVECGGKATFIMVTKPENEAFIRKANMIPVTNIDDALRLAYEKCGTENPKITVMPHGANTLPQLKEG
ncbi:nickel-dependent lactate racemase [Sporomusa malonica]|uniref:Nickel-dependent lactate racemase n=1 Tax=Sporomusa malonica TaxID=112901 RepID=A0A1W2EEH6_9FIRM|nr:nickel-dependent lactate racemase [Sporomusa malonica]SMD08143.1 Nickel-dependent lactate racemase [Sporomusa malonica]